MDALLDVGEVFGVWYIEGPEALAEKLPFKKAGLNVHVVPQVAPYKKRKVRILNGAHTGFVLGAYLSGQNIVRDCMHNETIHSFMNKLLFKEVIPILPLDKKDCENFAAAVTDRFNNPFVDHLLIPADEYFSELHFQVEGKRSSVTARVPREIRKASGSAGHGLCGLHRILQQ